LRANDSGCFQAPHNVLLDIPAEEGEVEDQRQPVAVDEEQKGEEAMDGHLGDNVSIEPVAKVDRVDVVTKRLDPNQRSIVRSKQKRSCRQQHHWPGANLRPRSLCSNQVDIPLKITVHDGEENLQEQIDGIYDDRKEVEPRFTRHLGVC